MARGFAKIYVSIWSDEDFKALPADLQHAYFVLMSQPRLSMCGLLDYMPNRLSKCCYEWTVDTVETLVKGLEKERYVVVDRDTNELLVRSFIRNDEVMRVPNLAKAAASAYGEVMSAELRDAIDDELRKAFKEAPDMAGWKALKESNPVLFRNVTPKDSGNP